MNKLEKIISEILGVPKEMTTSKVKEMVERYIGKLTYELKEKNLDTKISKLKILTLFENSYIDILNEHISITTEFIPNDSTPNKISLVSAGAPYSSKINDDDKIEISVRKSFLEVYIFISVGNDLTLGDLVRELNKQEFKNNITSVMYHEIKHIMDANYNNTRSINSVVDYNLKNNKRINSQSFNRFMFYAYLTTITESLVRNTQLYGEIKTNNVLKKDFYSFLTNSKHYKKLKEIQEYSWETFIDDLLSEKEHLIKYYELKNINSDEEFLTQIQKIFISLIKNKKMENIDAIIDGMKLSRYNKYIKHLTFIKDVNKFNNFKQYFNYELKKMKDSASKTLKKMGKIYDLAKDNDNVNQLMQKINSNMSEQSIYDPETYDYLKLNNKL